ncbi:DUF732 domain-containing protein [Microcoleus sp. FACHB-1515]|uniref:DUF732 domain-containing protein n=1 Tax=Cyanophyceae TaxID=3028117 RepID=UPI001686BAB5|nr:DUF732 domain-containing protein [Microcoleus sp. FACHB-1515]MBD2089250.1 DUF732 domain-containing protein [Microcoleus sp. FACHB-1515]
MSGRPRQMHKAGRSKAFTCRAAISIAIRLLLTIRHRNSRSDSIEIEQINLVRFLWIGLFMLLSGQAQASEAILPDPYGICSVGELGGRSIVNSASQLVSLNEYCQQQVQLVEQQTPPPDPTQNAFWEAFLNIASPAAIEYSESIDRQQLLAYSTTICPFLSSGGTLPQIRSVQVQSGLPAAFDAAVNVAAIHTYCPQFINQIGR